MQFDITPTLLASIVLIVVLTTVEISIRLLKRRTKYAYSHDTKEITDTHELELVTIRFFKKMQTLDLLRLGAFVFAGLVALLIYDVQAFSYIVVALGALVIVMKENVNSIAAYFYILSHYDVGDDVKINGNLGEIIRIRPLSLALAGKDESGDYNGKLFQIPNFMLLQQIVEVQELKSQNYQRVLVKAVFNAEKFSDSFEVWLAKLKDFLTGELPQRKLGDVGHYRGFAGKKFKLNYDYDADGEVFVHISFISSPSKALERKETIVGYIESTRKVQKQEKKAKGDK